MRSFAAAPTGRPLPIASPARREAPALTASVLAEAADLDRLEPDWWDLFGRCPSATPFQSPAWLIPWWRQFRPGDLAAVAVRAGGRLVGLAPLYAEEGARGRRLLPLGIGPSDHLDLLLDPEAAGAGAALAEGIAAARGGCATLDLEDLAPEAAAWQLPVPAGAAERVEDQVACPVLLLPREAASLADLCSSQKRRKIALARNRSLRRGGFQVEAATSPRETAALFERLAALHAARWESRGEAGVLADPAVQAFHREAVPRLARAGLVRFHAVRLAGEVAGILYALRGRRRVYTYLSGFDPAFAFESPGVTLVAAALDAAREEGARAFHFLRGQEPYKYEWGAVDIWNRRRSLRWS
ncbi:glycosyl transferase, group 1 [Methylobacterium sp. 4-46]|uniref:GNAT family N-acetyltransferase n=1 Tax=unclassified Methylobacterium TaxID=2615210 RepID=UPI000152C7F8|nr:MULTISPECIES: GNAT family N-acetyltransferase [Methylobacterium]ACA16166.1 glycosyl transferase, group 1 [Methylobacterium sp. 4-46]WFT81875.1 GNAT family N-acetyltransferase [Methylobacterium nodulans]